MKTIRVKVGEEYQVKIAEQPDQDDFFFPAYEQAANELVEIIHDTEVYYKRKENNEKKNNNIDYSNNIIAFDGDRGQGKSSAMLSFSRFLENKRRIDILLGDGEKDVISPSQYLVLQRIDPTKIENNENILTIILAKLFHCYMQSWKNDHENNQQQKSDILQRFENCYNEIEAIKNSSHEKDSYPLSNLEKLKRIGDSESLKHDFHELILMVLKNYFKKVEKNDSKLFLVIQLDDTDLNPARAHEIVEDVRKYFMIPNVIVLMAADIEQLTCAIEQDYIKQFELFDSMYKDSQKLFIKYHRMAVKYIDKLIPGKRDVHLPILKAASRETPDENTLIYTDPNNNDKNVLESRDINDKELVDIQDIVLRFIYRKTGLIFIKPTNYLHYIIPRTMRGLVNFLSILNSLTDVESDRIEIKPFSKNQLINRLHNIEVFETFFISNWIPSHLDAEYRDIIQNYIETPWTIKSKQLIQDLRNKYSAFRMRENKKQYDDVSFLYKDGLVNDSETVPLASVRDVLTQLENFFPNQELFKFIFSIRTLYSIIASKIICNNLITENTANPDSKETIFQFFGGEIFGQNTLRFIRKEEGEFDRSVFEVNYQESPLRDIANNPVNAGIISLFCVFSFPGSQQDQYNNFFMRIQAGNNVYSKNIRFNVTLPFLHLYQRSLAFQKVNLEGSTLSEYPLDQDRLACINILSSLELMNKIEREFLENSSTKRSEAGWNQSDYVIAFFQRIQDVIHSVSYLPLSFSFEGLIKLIDENKDALNNLHDDFKKEEKHQRSKSRPKIFHPRTIRETRSFELLKTHILNLSENLIRIQKQKKNISFHNEIELLRNLFETIQPMTGNMTQKDRDEYQRVYNKVARSAQKKLKEEKDENQQTKS